MGSKVLPDPGSEFGERVRARLRDEQVIWFTRTAADGTPQPNPVWFVFEDPSTILVYNRSGAHRRSHIGPGDRELPFTSTATDTAVTSSC